jgi:hypothetical protein
MILVFYIFFTLIDQQENEWKERDYTMLMILAMFAVIIKISTLPVLLIAFVPLIMFKLSAAKKITWLLKLSAFACLIIVPWLIRNVIISGYLLFPVPLLDIFSVDWKVPMDILVAEKQHVSNAPRMISEDFAYVDQLPFISKITLWIPRLWAGNLIDFILIFLAFISPLFAWLMVRKSSIKNPSFVVWVIAYAGLWFWLIGSPDVRFGFPYIISSILFPLLFFAKRYLLPNKSFIVFIPVIVVLCFYYDYKALKMLALYQASDWIYKPLKHPEYLKNNDMKTFKYVLLNNNTKLYIHDSTHHTINAPLPSCAPYREGIRMRGNTLQEGFRNVR